MNDFCFDSKLDLSVDDFKLAEIAGAATAASAFSCDSSRISPQEEAVS